MGIRAILGAFLSVISRMSPSLDPVGCSFTICPTSNPFSNLFCYHLGPSNHRLSAGLEPQPPHWCPGFHSSQCPTICPLLHYLSDLHAYWLPCCFYHGPFASTILSDEMLFFWVPMWLISLPPSNLYSNITLTVKQGFENSKLAITSLPATSHLPPHTPYPMTLLLLSLVLFSP